LCSFGRFFESLCSSSLLELELLLVELELLELELLALLLLLLLLLVLLLLLLLEGFFFLISLAGVGLADSTFIGFSSELELDDELDEDDLDFFEDEADDFLELELLLLDDELELDDEELELELFFADEVFASSIFIGSSELELELELELDDEELLDESDVLEFPACDSVKNL